MSTIETLATIARDANKALRDRGKLESMLREIGHEYAERLADQLAMGRLAAIRESLGVDHDQPHRYTDGCGAINNLAITKERHGWDEIDGVIPNADDDSIVLNGHQATS